MQAREASRKAPVTVAAHDTVRSAAQLMDEFAVGAVVVLEDGHPWAS